MINYINKEAGINLTKVFDQYLKHKKYSCTWSIFEKDKLYYRWIADVAGFDMPIPVGLKVGSYTIIKPNTAFQVMDIPGITKENFRIDDFNFYVGLMKN